MARYIAHRGASKEKKQNTAAAFEYAAQTGVYGVETDIRITRDGMVYKTNMSKRWNYEVRRDCYDECFCLVPKERLAAFVPWVDTIESWEPMDPDGGAIDGFRWSIKFGGDGGREIFGVNQAPEGFGGFISAIEDLLQRQFTCGPGWAGAALEAE